MPGIIEIVSRTVDSLDISVVIVNFNTRLLLQKCIDSIIEKFGGISHEIIVVDNNSKDGSVEMVQRRYPGTVLIKNDYNAGFSKANNQGIKIAKGRYVILANSDTEVRHDGLGKMLDFMDENPKVGMLGPKLLLPDGSIQPSASSFTNLFKIMARELRLKHLLFSEDIKEVLARRFNSILGSSLRSYLSVYDGADSPRWVDWLGAAFLIIRREVFDDVGYWDEDFFMYGEDEDFQLRAVSKGWKAVYYPGFEVLHHAGASGKGNPLVLAEWYRSCILLWHKHRPLWGVIIVRTIVFVSFGMRYIFCGDKNLRQAYRKIMEYVVHKAQYAKENKVLGV